MNLRVILPLTMWSIQKSEEDIGKVIQAQHNHLLVFPTRYVKEMIP